jgi:glycerophosphoryl diester phosphodiesterase
MRKCLIVLAIIFPLIISSCKTAKLNRSAMLPLFDKEGHRGCRGLMPENTLPAMLKAIELGVTTLEMDVSFTKDSQAILSHEPFFNRDITTLPDGNFINAKDEKQYNLYKLSYAEILRYDVGMKPHPKFPRQQKIPVTKALLSDVIDGVEKYIRDKKLPPVFYNIETKTNPLTDNIYHPAPQPFVDMLMKVINEKGIGERVIIQSFDFRTLQIMHRDHPNIKTSMLIEDYDKRSLQEQIKALGFTPTVYSPAHELVSKSLVDQCHELHIKVVPWTINNKARIAELKALGVDGIITDYPDLFNDEQ